MCLDKKNQLKMPFEDYQANQAARLCSDIPKERRQELAEELQVRAAIAGCQNRKALEKVVKKLKEDS